MTRPDAFTLSQPLYGARFLEALARFFRKYVVFSGRASRSEYWWPVVANLIVVVAGYICLVVGMVSASADARSMGTEDLQLNAWQATLVFAGVALLYLWPLAILLPQISVTVRRLHDANYSALLALLLLVPFGGIILLFFAARPSDPLGARFDVLPHPAARPSERELSGIQ